MVQGTGAVALAAVVSAIKSIGLTPTDLTKQRIVIVGAGSAGLGVANSIKYGMIEAGLLCFF